MASFDEHINHSKRNLDFLTKANNLINDRWDWQVTVCFYTALHLMNAHIVKKTLKNYLSHNQVEDVLNPYALSPARIDEETFLSYQKLSQLSRRSRYLLNENFDRSSDLQIESLTYSPHFKKAIHHLDIIIDFINSNYPNSIYKTEIICIDLKGRILNNFIVK